MDQFDLKLAVNQELGVETAKTVLVSGERQVVPGSHILKQDPCWPSRTETALSRASGEDPAGIITYISPCGRRDIHRESSLLEDVLVVIEDRGGSVKRHGVEVLVLGIV
jgi:hypothetical protein